MWRKPRFWLCSTGTGESKLVVSVQLNLDKMKLVQKLFKESVCFKGWSSELQKIPLVEIDRCKVELVTEKNYKKYVTTVDGSLDVMFKGGDGADGMDKEDQNKVCLPHKHHMTTPMVTHYTECPIWRRWTNFGIAIPSGPCEDWTPTQLWW